MLSSFGFLDSMLGLESTNLSILLRITLFGWCLKPSSSWLTLGALSSSITSSSWPPIGSSFTNYKRKSSLFYPPSNKTIPPIMKVLSFSSFSQLSLDSSLTSKWSSDKPALTFSSSIGRSLNKYHKGLNLRYQCGAIYS